MGRFVEGVILVVVTAALVAIYTVITRDTSPSIETDGKYYYHRGARVPKEDIPLGPAVKKNMGKLEGAGPPSIRPHDKRERQKPFRGEARFRPESERPAPKEATDESVGHMPSVERGPGPPSYNPTIGVLKAHRGKYNFDKDPHRDVPEDLKPGQPAMKRILVGDSEL